MCTKHPPVEKTKVHVVVAKKKLVFLTPLFQKGRTIAEVLAEVLAEGQVEKGEILRAEATRRGKLERRSVKLIWAGAKGVSLILR
jgi:hypothetical protein